MVILFTEETLSEKKDINYMYYIIHIKNPLYTCSTHTYILHEYCLYTVTHTCTHTLKC